MSLNQLHDIPFNTFYLLHNLRRLVLKNNSLDSLHPQLLAQLSKLTELNLVGNKLGHLQPDVFQGLTNLQILSLKSNQLRAVENGTLEFLRNLNAVYLSGNLWDCTCTHIIYISRWVNMHRDKLRDQPMCFFSLLSNSYPTSSSSHFTQDIPLSQAALSPLLLQDHCITSAASGSSPLFPLELLNLLFLIAVSLL